MTQPKDMLDEFFESYTKTAANIITYFEGDERKEKVDELKEMFKINCMQSNKLDKLKHVKERVLANYDENEERETEDIIQEYKRAVEELEQDVTNIKQVQAFEHQIKALLQNKGDEGEGEDEDLQMTGGYVNVIDPISKKRIVDPVKNNVCGHTYDRETITGLLKLNKKTRCPVIGCKAMEYVKLDNLKKDIVTQTYLEEHPE